MPYTRQCPCGTVFATYRSGQVYCSHSCAATYGRWGGGHRTHQPCVACGANIVRRLSRRLRIPICNDCKKALGPKE